jgi:SAM-dependent methyltransferase
MIKRAVIKRLMKLRESEIKFDTKEGAFFKELFDHPYYLSLDEKAQIDLGLQWARNLYLKEVEHASLDAYLGDIDLAEYFKGAIMLDVGCYLGSKTVRWLERYQGAEIHGIDIDSRFIKIATCFAREKMANAHFYVNYAEKLSFPDAFFDVILSECTFEHVRDIKKVMQECDRVLKKRGFIVIIFPSFWGPFSHHLDLVTNTPFIHWFFKYPALLESYFSILDERGDDALWYRRQDEHPLPFEKGYSINGTGAMEFHKLVKDKWDIIIDGFRQKTRKKEFVINSLTNCIKVFPFLRDLHTIAYVLQKR